MQVAAIKGSHLSPQQVRLWSLQAGNQAYRCMCSIVLDGPLEKERFLQALQQVAMRHEILHTVFHRVPEIDMPMQVVKDDLLPFCLDVSLEGLTVLEQDVQMHTYTEAALGLAFNLAQGPLFHLYLLRLSPQHSVLLVSLSALCADAATLKHLICEVCQTYLVNEELIKDEPDNTEALLEYADIGAWQQSLLQEEDALEAQAYWRELDPTKFSTRLPFEDHSHAEHTFSEENMLIGKNLEVAFRPHNFPIPLNSKLENQLHALAQCFGVSPEVVLLTCWQIVLGRLTRDANVVVGVVCDGRHYNELETALGLLTRVLPVSAPFEKEWSFSHALSQVGSTLEHVIEQQEYFTWDIFSTSPGESRSVARVLPLSFSTKYGRQTYMLVQYVSHWTSIIVVQNVLLSSCMFYN